MIWIETRKGRIQQRLKLAEHLDPRTVMPAFGWWFPEEGKNQYQWRKVNINILTDNDPPYDASTGSVQLRGVPCRVYSERSFKSEGRRR